MSDSDSSDDGVTMSSNKVPIESSDDSSSSEEEEEESGPKNDTADYSIGDRVEVKWHHELFDATVVKVNPSGSVDVKYDIDGSGGIFLTAEEHGLKLLGDEEKKGGGKKKVCSAGGCPNNVYARGFCHHHSNPNPSVPAYTANSAGISSAFGQGATISRPPVVYIDMAHCTILHAGWQDESLSTQLKAKQAGGASNKPSGSRTDRGPSKKRIALGKKTGTKAGAGAGAAATLSAQTATRVPELRVCIQYKTLLEKAADNAQIVFQCEMFVLPAGGARREDQGEDRQQDSTVGAVTERTGCVDAPNAPQSSDAASTSTPERVVEQLRLASAEFRKPASNWHCMIEMGGIYVLRNLLVQTLIIGSKEICTYAADSESTMETVAATDQTAVETLASQKSIENAAQVLSTVSDALMLRASAHRFKRGSGGGGGSSSAPGSGSGHAEQASRSIKGIILKTYRTHEGSGGAGIRSQSLAMTLSSLLPSSPTRTSGSGGSKERPERNLGTCTSKLRAHHAWLSLSMPAGIPPR